MSRFESKILPVFYVEAGYINDFSAEWKLQNAGFDEHGVTAELCARWQNHRRELISYRGRNNGDVRRCLDFMDSLVSDWLLKLTGKQPIAPLDDARLAELRQHHANLFRITDNVVWYK